MVRLSETIRWHPDWGIVRENPADVWGAILAGHVLRALLSVARFAQGHRERIVVNVESSS